MRLSKLQAAAHLGISPTTVDRRIQRGELQSEKEAHGTRYRIWVILDDEPPEELGGEPREESADYSPDEPITSAGEPHDSSGESSPPPPEISGFVQIAILEEQKKSAEDRAATLEELASYHRQLLADSEWRYQEILQELRQSQQNVAALTRALPAPKEDPAEEEPQATTAVGAEAPTCRQRRRWWPFGKK